MMNKKQKSNKTLDILKANRKGSRDAELENSNGFKSTHKVFKSKKTYNRKSKNSKINKLEFYYFISVSFQ